MKKQRGLRRYYKNLEFKTAFDNIFLLSLRNPHSWPKYQHWHFDYKGLGNTSFNKRKPHLDKLFRHFDFLKQALNSANFDFQLYAIVLDDASSSDALFLHTIDQNDNPFPFKLETLSRSSTLNNKAFNAYIEKLDGYERLYGFADQPFCLLYDKNMGNPLKSNN